MNLSLTELAALCEYVDGRRAAGCTYDSIADDLAPYTLARPGAEPRMTEDDLDDLELWHRQWTRRQAYMERQRESGDPRGGTGGIAEVAIDWQSADAGAIKIDHSKAAPDITLSDRADTLQAIAYLKKGLLKARWKWVFHKLVPLLEGMTWETIRGPGSATLPDGTVAAWLSQAVILRRSTGIVDVFSECRRKQIRKPGWMGGKHPRIVIQRREVDGEKIDVRDISARLATLLHTCLGPVRSTFRSNEHLAKLLGVTREAMRVRKKRIMTKAGIRSGEGLAPARAAGGRATQAKRRGKGAIAEGEPLPPALRDFN